MMKTWKRVVSLCLCAMMMLGVLCACGEDPTPTEAPGPTQTPEEAKVLKVLTLGHSLTLDSCHMLVMIAGIEGYENLVVGTLYYSGCSLAKHAQFIREDAKEYDLYLSSSDAPQTPPKAHKSVSMQDALGYDYWDIVVMQGGAFQIAQPGTYQDGNIQFIQEYVLENVPGIAPKFAWNMTWAPPTDNALRDTYPHTPNTYYSNYAMFEHSRAKFYEILSDSVKNNIMNDPTFSMMIPTGTAMENALSSYLEEKDLHRDYVHASDLGRLIASYTWFCRLTGVSKLDSLMLDVVPRAFLVSTKSGGDWRLTQAQKNVILEAVNNALANPLQITPSQYTTAG